MSEARYLIRTNQGDKGPYTAEQIRAFVDQNQLPPQAQVVDMQVTTAADILSTGPAQTAPATQGSTSGIRTSTPQPGSASGPRPATAQDASSAVRPAAVGGQGSGARPAAPAANDLPAMPTPPAEIADLADGFAPRSGDDSGQRSASAMEVAPPPDFSDIPAHESGGHTTRTGSGGHSTRGGRRRGTGRVSKRGGEDEPKSRRTRRGNRRTTRTGASTDRDEIEADLDDRPHAKGSGSSAMPVIIAIAAVVVLIVAVGLWLALGSGEEFTPATLTGQWHVNMDRVQGQSWFRRSEQWVKEEVLTDLPAVTVEFTGDSSLAIWQAGDGPGPQPYTSTTVSDDRFRLDLQSENDADQIVVYRRDGTVWFDRSGRPWPLVQGPSPAYVPPTTTAQNEDESAPDAEDVEGAATDEATGAGETDAADAADAADATDAADAADAAATDTANQSDADTATDATDDADTTTDPDATVATPPGDTGTGPAADALAPENEAIAAAAKSVLVGTWHINEEKVFETRWAQAKDLALNQEGIAARTRFWSTLAATRFEFTADHFIRQIGNEAAQRMPYTVIGETDDGQWRLQAATDDKVVAMTVAQEDGNLVLTTIGPDGEVLPLTSGPPSAERVEQYQKE